jgi:hypothetical protein
MDDPPQQRRRAALDRMASLLGQFDPGDARDLQRCIDLARLQLVRDTRLFPFEVSGNVRQGRAVLGGYVLFPEHKAALIELLRTLGSDPEDHIQTGPLTSGDGLAYGMVTSPLARLYSSPAPPRETVTELRAEDPVFLLKGAQEHLLCLGPDGYSGYIAASDLRRIDAATMTSLLNRRPHPTQKLDPILQTARTFLGTRYVWGGTSDAGIDCSGLVQRSFAAHGIHLPRDADQQVYIGRLVATRWHRDALRPGDLLFFLGRRGSITHVALHLGGSEFIEASGDSVKITSFDPAAPNYSARRLESFCFAKRVLE